LNAVYDLSRYPANFNFLEFLVAATTRGATHIAFNEENGVRPKFSLIQTMERLESIVFPSCKFAGCTYGAGSEGIDPGYHISAVMKAWKDTGRIRKLTPPEPIPCKYTVTLRDYDRFPQRNSNREVWLEFAREIGAVVIDDWYRKKITIEKRFALYAGADMNFMVATGPSALCMFSEVPYCIWLKAPNKAYHQEHGFPVGSQLPWANDRQVCLWEEDSRENLRKWV